MTIREAINLARQLKQISPTNYPDALMLQFINECEGKIQTEFLRISEIDCQRYTEDDLDKHLIVSPPHDKLYYTYLCAMIDFTNGEYNKYQNAIVIANSFMAEWAAWFNRTHRRDGREYQGVFLSAYGIAVKWGYEGTEEEWLDTLVGREGPPGASGVSPVATVESITGGHRVTITDADGPKSFNVMDGKDGSGTGGGSGGGVSKASELENDVPFVSAGDAQTLTDAQKERARVNIGASHIRVESTNIGGDTLIEVIVTDADGNVSRFNPKGSDGGVWVPEYNETDGTIEWRYTNNKYITPVPVPIPIKTSDLENDSGFIPAPATAAVGQTIVVSEVDADGKPTKWEAGEFGSGGFSYDNSELIQSVTFAEETKLFCVDLDYSKYQAVFATIDVNTNSRMYLKIAGKTPVFLSTLCNGATLLIIPFSDTVAFVSYDTTKGSPYGPLGEKQSSGLYCLKNGISFDRLELEHETTFAVGDKIEVYGIAR